MAGYNDSEGPYTQGSSGASTHLTHVTDITNKFDKDATPVTGDTWVWDGTFYVPVPGTLNVRGFGVTGDGTTDDSSALQTALNTAATAGLTAQLEPLSTVRCVSAITIPSGLRLDLNGATIKNASVSTTGRLLILSGVTGVQIFNGVLDGDKAGFATVTEQRHNLHIINSSRVLIQDVLSKNAKGDGVYIGDDVAGHSSDVTLINVWCESNHRNGESITAAKRVRHYSCRFTLNGGTSPQSGIDVEPNADTAPIENINYDSCSFDTNAWDGVNVQARQTPSVRQGGVRFVNCTSNGNGTAATGTVGNGIVLRWMVDFSWHGEVRDNALMGVYFRDTCSNLRFDTDVVSNGKEGYGQPAGTITDLVIRGYIFGNGTSSAAGTFDGVNLAGTGTGLAFDAVSGGTQQRNGLRTVSTWAHVAIGPECRFPNNTTATVSLSDDISTRVVLSQGITGGFLPVGRAATGSLPTPATAGWGLFLDSTTKRINLSDSSTFREVANILDVTDRFGIVRTIVPQTSTGLVTIGSANTSRFFRVIEGGSVSSVRINVGVQSGNIAVAAYSNTGSGLTAAPGTRLATSGSVACPAVGIADVSLGATITLAVGDWLAIGADNATATFTGVNGGGDSTLSGGQAGVHATFPPATSPTLTYQNNRLISLIGVP